MKIQCDDNTNLAIAYRALEKAEIELKDAISKRERCADYFVEQVLLNSEIIKIRESGQYGK